MRVKLGFNTGIDFVFMKLTLVFKPSMFFISKGNSY